MRKPCTNYEVWASDSTGNFANQRRIGTGTGSPVSVTLPTGYNALQYGMNYRLKVVAPDLGIASSISNSLTIGNLTTASITDSRNPTVYASGAIICPTDQVRFDVKSVNNSGGNAPADACQWLLNGTAIAGAISHTYLAGHAGNYQVQVQQANCTIQSLVYSLSKSSNSTIYISSRFGSLPQCADSPGVLSSTPYPGELATFQWKRDGVDIAGATSATYATNQSGEYSFNISGNGCSINQPTLRMSFGNALYARLQKFDSVLCAGPSTGSIAIRFEDIDGSHTGSGGYAVQWYKDGQPTNASVNQSYFSASQPGTYVAELRQGSCLARTNAVVINQGTVVPPSITYYDTGLSYKNRFSQIQPFSVRIQHSKFNFEYV